MKSMVLHIGIPKTGSSALQVFWARNRDVLLKQSVDYFRMGDFALGARGKISSGNGAHIARSLLRPQGVGFKADRDKQLAALDEQIAASTCETGLLSSEMFIFAPDASLVEFRDWLAERGVALRIFYFIRSQLQFLTSSYIQQVKRHGCTETSEEYILRLYEKLAHIKYSKLFDRMARIAGRDNVICKNYHDNRSLAHGIYDAFLGSFGLSAEGIEFIESDVNVSLNMSEIKVMLILNKLKPRMVFSDLIVENAVRRGRKSDDVVHQLLSRATLEKIESYFADDNARFAKAYFGKDTLFDKYQSTAAHPHPAPTETTVTEVVEIFGGLLVRFDERLAALEQKLRVGGTEEAE